MTDREKLIEEAVTQALSESDNQNHEDLCHCGLWPNSCVTYGNRKPWSHDAESVARAALAVFEKAHAPTEREQEYGWEWASNAYTGPFPIHGSTTKESAERAMEGTSLIAPVRIMVRDKAVPGEWREA
ncbi:hypothetical protein LUPINE_99 [Microbacterium phage Lupine]|nr:hypothetical protein LUPINE_99 [Microbacterium phage Lupine]